MKKKIRWILILGVLLLVFHFIFFKHPTWTEQLYHNGLFKMIRIAYDFTLGYLPFPSFYLFIGAVGYFVFRFFSGLKALFKDFSSEKLKSFIVSFMLFIMCLVCYFYISWGYNYARPTFKEQLSFPTVKIDSTIVAQEARLIMSKLTLIRNQITTDNAPLDDQYLPEDLETITRRGIMDVLYAFDKKPIGRGRVRKLNPEGILLRFSTAGIYMPFAFEGQIDKGLHPLQYPFVMAHEMGHVYGYAEEGTCNYLGFLACMESEDLFVQYSGMLGYWRYLISNLRKTAPYTYQKIRNEISPALRNDLDAIYDQMDKFPDILPKLRNQVYNTYLQSNGIKDGINNYNMIVQLTMQWKESGKNSDLLSKIYDRG